ncbi:DUF202 domain-containing protein [Streptomyces iconiensis]|uniref:DUF202 domain-containing protein n=1 Tax=Streptomyces iconiensis TaxID=1384038 RepID=A0ABT6ZZC6_9ACTN|nr:DUF202 domain-containing protein [Streptomyces iconiensis]MDJ1134400.1 DUF202 domain-containing protein [Streptomyces iconiensis]
MSAEDGPRVPHPRDPGAQPERTRLAWRRTTLTCAVAVALAVRVAVVRGTAVAVLAAALGALAWLALLLGAHRRIGRLAETQPVTMGAAEVRGTLICLLVLIGVGVMLLWTVR